MGPYPKKLNLLLKRVFSKGSRQKKPVKSVTLVKKGGGVRIKSKFGCKKKVTFVSGVILREEG